MIINLNPINFKGLGRKETPFKKRMKGVKKMKHYKVYLNLYENNKRIEREQRDLIILKLIEQDRIRSRRDNKNRTFCINLNRDKNKYYPIYYDRVYYFGSPVVLSSIREDKLKELLEFFKEQGLKFWITYLYEMYNFEELKVFNNNFSKVTDLKMEDINNERKYLFQSKINLVNEYKNQKAIIQNNTEINKIIEATK